MTTEPNKFAIELWDIDDIKPYPKNAKKHPDDQVQALAGAIRKFGHDQPIVLDANGFIIKGHGRRLAVIFNHKNFDGPRKAPVIVRRDLSQADADAARLSDNRVTSTFYDSELLAEELQRLQVEEGFDMREAGFTDKELDFSSFDNLGGIDGGAFVDDISAAVEGQKAENKAKEAEVDTTAAPIGDAFGFKRVTVENSRKIREFMGRLEKAHGKEGVDALIAHIDMLDATSSSYA